MTLTTQQLFSIEKFLDRNGLAHVDLRNEVLDHMANGIEKSMEVNDIVFKKALDLEIKKWSPELTAYSSWWLGIAWSGPKIMMKKCVRLVKEIYLKTLIASLLLTVFLFLLLSFYRETELSNGVTKIIGVLYVVIFGIILFCHFKMKLSGYDTSYRCLFKIHAVGIAFVYILYNPLWTFDAFSISNGSDINYAFLWLHSWTLTFVFVYLKLYRMHFKTRNLRLV